jgi:hypothetical protein
VYAFNEDKDPKDSGMGNYWEQMGYVPCPYYDRVSWEELMEESLSHDVHHVDHVDHTLHSAATS